MRLRSVSVLIFGLLLSAQTAHAQDTRTEASSAFDRGVRHFENAEYELAAKAFARADELMPAPNALRNAIASARKAGSWLLVAELAERAERRAIESPDVAAQAREALAEAAPRLVRLELSCRPEPCVVQLDDERIGTGTRWALPGTHFLRATGESGAKDDETIQAAAGATYRIVLHPAAEGAAPIATEVSKARTAEGGSTPTEDRGGSESESGRPLSPTVFWIGVGASVALAGLTTWSGLDALSAKDELPAQPTTTQSDDVRSKVLRTDLLLAGTVLVGGLTTYAGFSLVDWGDGRASATIIPTAGGALASVEGRF
jgi:hypothetical protein